MQPLIAITTGEIVDHAFPWAPVAYGKAHTYTDSVVSAGGTPILIPYIDDEQTLHNLYERCDGILFSGGNDLDPATYNSKQSKGAKDVSPRRDKQEELLFKWALEDDKPVLGICRGMQLINSCLGGGICQDIAHETPTATDHEVSIRQKDFKHLAHKLKLDPTCKLAVILGSKEVQTNSLHHQSVAGLGQGLLATAWSEDGLIEAIELPTKTFIIGVQSHPEALSDVQDLPWDKLFRAFVDASSRQ